MAREMESAKFPTAKVVDSDIGVATNREGKTLTASVPDQSSDTTIDLSGTNGLEADEYAMLVGADGYEITRVKSVDANASEATVTRGEDGTTERAFEENDSFVPIVPALTINQLRAEVVAVEDWLGADGDTITWDRNLVLQPSTTDGTYPLTIDILSGHGDPEPFIDFRRSTDSGDTYSSVGSIDYDPTNDDLEFSGFTLVAATDSDILLEDDQELRWGTEPKDYWATYDSSGTQFLFRSTDVDGGGTDGTIWSVQDGSDAVTFHGDVLTDTDASSDLGTSGTRWSTVYQEIANLDQYAQFSPISSPSHSEGLVFYDTDRKSLAYYNEESDVQLNIGRESFLRVRNDTGSTITNGTPVKITGFQGTQNLPLIAAAQADTEANAAVVGVTTHDIENNTNGYVTLDGEVRGIDTSSFSAGDELWLDPGSAGGFVNSRPSSPNFARRIGTVVRSSAGNGVIDVAVVREAHGSFTQGSIPFANSSGLLVEDNTHLVWNDSGDTLRLDSADASDNAAVDSSTLAFRGSYDSDASATVTPADRDMSLQLVVDYASAAGEYRLAVLDDADAEFVTFEGDTQRVGIQATSPNGVLDVRGGDVIINEDGGSHDFRVESTNEDPMLEVTGAQDQVNVHTSFNADWGALNVGARNASNGTEVDMIATLSDSGDSADVNGNNQDAWGVRIGNPTLNSASGATTITNSAALYVPGPLQAGTDLTITNQYVALFEDGAGSKLFRFTSGGTFDIVSGSLDISGTTLFENDRDVAVDLLPNASAGGSGLDLGSASRYWDTVFARTVQVENQGAGSDPTLTSNDASQVATLTGGLDVTSRINLPNSSSIQDAGTDAIAFNGSQDVSVPNGRLLVGGTGTPNGTLEITGTVPSEYLNETDASDDEKLYRSVVTGGALVHQTRTDADGSGETWLRVTRTGTTVDEVLIENGQLGVGVGTGSTSFLLHHAGGNYAHLGAPSSSPTTANMDNGSLIHWLDETNDEVEFVAKYSDGTVKTGTLAVS